MSEKEPQKKFADAVECIQAAARLHVMMDEHSTHKAIKAALQWRYGISSWEADSVVKSALALLDAMPLKQ